MAGSGFGLWGETDFAQLRRQAQWIHKYGAPAIAILLLVGTPIHGIIVGAGAGAQTNPDDPATSTAIGAVTGFILGALLGALYAVAYFVAIRMCMATITCITDLRESIEQ